MSRVSLCLALLGMIGCGSKGQPPSGVDAATADASMALDVAPDQTPAGEAAAADVAASPEPDAAADLAPPIDTAADAPPSREASVDLSAREQELCAGLATLSLEAVGWTPAAIAPGQEVELGIDLVNHTATSFSYYPGVYLVVDAAGVTLNPPMGNFRLFALLPGKSFRHTWRVTFASTIPPGSTIRFRAEAAALNVARCYGAGAIDFAVTLM